MPIWATPRLASLEMDYQVAFLLIRLAIAQRRREHPILNDLQRFWVEVRAVGALDDRIVRVPIHADHCVDHNINHAAAIAARRLRR